MEESHVKKLKEQIDKAGAAESQAEYESAYESVFEIMDELEALLGEQTFLEGEQACDEDMALYEILIRFDAVYYSRNRLNRNSLRDFKNLWRYARELYARPEYRSVTDFKRIKEEELLGNEKTNPYGIVALGPDEGYWKEDEMDAFEYVEVNGRRIRVRPKETLQEIDENGYFVRQPNHFTIGFGEGENPVEAGRYRLIWAKLCHWSNRASIVRELLGLDAISVNMVGHTNRNENLGWEFIYDEGNVDPVLGIQFLSEAYYKADESYAGRTTVPALIDVQTGKVVNNDYHRLTNYFEVDFRAFHKEDAPDLYPMDLRTKIDSMNNWLFDNINNAVYKTAFARSKRAYWDAYNTFYAAMDILDERLSKSRFLFGDYVTDSDVRLYVTLARLDIRYAFQLGHTKHRLIDYKNLWPYARDLWQIPAFRNNTYFRDFANPSNVKTKGTFQTFNARFLDEIDFEGYWGAPHGRAALSSDPGNKFIYEKPIGKEVR